MKISVTYTDGTVEAFSNVVDTDFGDNFVSLNDGDGETIVDLSYAGIRKIQYD